MGKIIRKGMDVVVMIIDHGILPRNAVESRYTVEMKYYPRITAAGIHER